MILHDNCVFLECPTACKFCDTPDTCLPNGCFKGYALDIESQTCLRKDNDILRARVNKTEIIFFS